MIGYLSGKVKFLFEDSFILNVNGVGYLIYVSNRILDNLNIDDDAEFYIHTVVREDSITLYGFKNQNDYKLFTHLITVSGIGAKTALNIMSKITAQELARAIYQKNMKILTNLPGVGKKSAERLILELKDKLDIETRGTSDSNISNIGEATEALLALGYTNAEIADVFKDVKSSMSTEELIKFALKKFSTI